jgi:N-acetylglucosaminyldiphosphoundecaprenol N-acetyl-beta-D-mannosaminyltransferase
MNSNGEADNGEPFARVDILGVGVSAITMKMAVNRIDHWIARHEPHYVCVATTHSINECQNDPRLREINRGAGMVTPDGMPLVWISHLRGFRYVERVYGPDLMAAVCAQSIARGYRHFLYGGWPPDVVEKLSANLCRRFAGLKIVGTHVPPRHPLTAAEDEDIVTKINSTRPDVVWVGTGAPRQEVFMGDHVGKLRAPVLIGVGAAFDFHAGTRRQAPRWMMRSGLEWLYRLAQEPRRLAPRYLVNNPRFVARVIMRSIRGGPARCES